MLRTNQARLRSQVSASRIPMSTKKPTLFEVGFFVFNGGDDEARTRDLRRDRPAF
jgi:hypothetical protein